MESANIAQAPTQIESVVSARQLAKRYGTGEAIVDALGGVDVDFASGTFTAIMGPSGSGKSTLLHILAGLDTPTGGSVTITGQQLDQLSDRQLTKLRRDKVGFIFQAFNLLPVLTADENILLPLSIAGRKPDPEWYEALLKATGLADRRQHRPAELSGGQQQRVAIARALITKPAVVFADEPTGALDSGTSEEILAVLRRSVDDFKQTIVMVTHEPTAAAVADRVLFLSDGLIVGDRTGLDVDGVLNALRDFA